MTIKDVIASCLVISLGIILVMHFILFWIYGGVFIYESNKIVLLGETIMSIAILGFGIERLLGTAKGNSNREVFSTRHNEVREQSSIGHVVSPSLLQANTESASSTTSTESITTRMSSPTANRSNDYRGIRILQSPSYTEGDPTVHRYAPYTAHIPTTGDPGRLNGEESAHILLQRGRR